MNKILFLSLFALLPIFSQATVWNVTNTNNSGAGSFSTAESFANDGDTIRFHRNILSNGSDTMSYHVGSQKNITIQGAFTSTDTLYFSGGGTSTIGGFYDVEKVTFDSMVFINGLAGYRGGAVSVGKFDSVIISNCIFRNNYAPNGGGALFLNNEYTRSDTSYARLENCIFENNSSSGDGGAILYHADLNIHLEIINSTIDNNSGNHGGGLAFESNHYDSALCNIIINSTTFSNNDAYNGDGGGILLISDDGGNQPSQVILNLEMENSNFLNNSAEDYGGGIFARCYTNSSLDSIHINNSTFEGNKSKRHGGGIYLYSYAHTFNTSNTYLQVTNSTFNGNVSLYTGNGGGIYIYNNSRTTSTLDVINSTFTDNTSAFGAAIYVFYTTANSTFTNVNILNSTIAFNTSTYNGAVLVLNSSSSFNTAQLSLTNSIVAHNGTSNISTSTSTTTNSGGRNIFSDATVPGSVASDQKGVTLTALNLGSLSYNGGTTRTIMPSAPSVAMNMGDSLDLSDAQNVPIMGIREVGAAEFCQATTGIDSVNACITYTWIDGITYNTNNNTAVHTLVNAAGCDSVVTLNLIINQPSYGTDSIVACDSLIWIDGITYFNNTSSPIDTLINSVGCDSIVTLNLIVNHTTYKIDTLFTCDSLTWIDGVTYTSNNNTAVDTLVNALGCDSIVFLNLTIQSSVSIDTVTSCGAYTWINGVTYTSNNNTATDTTTNVFGCDSIVYLDLTITPFTSTDTIIACSSYTWINGITYTTNNTSAKDTLITSSGCDSVITLHLTLSQSQSDYSFIDTGNGEFVFTNTTSGTYTNSHWAFGDGTTSTQENPVHSYLTNGKYIVSLATYDSVTYGDSCINYFVDTIDVIGVSNPLKCNAGWVAISDSNSGNVIIINSSTGTNLTYHWDFGDGDTSSLKFPSHTYSTNGPFNLCLFIDDGTGCSDSYCDSINSNGVLFKNGFDLIVQDNGHVGIKDVQANPEVNIYPNPASSILNIEAQNFKIEYIQILDYSGKIVLTENTSFKAINLKEISSGVYFIKLINDEQVITKKLIKR